MYLARLKRYDPTLHFVITLTEDRALAQAKKADEEIAAGKYRGPLHGIPWGAKGPARRQRLSDHLGRGRIRAPDHRRRRHRGPAAGRGRRGAGGQVHAGRAGHGRPLVWRADAQSVEPQPGLERLLGGPRQRRRGRLRRLRHRLGDAGVHLARLPRAAATPACAPPSASFPAPAPWP